VRLQPHCETPEAWEETNIPPGFGKSRKGAPGNWGKGLGKELKHSQNKQDGDRE